MTNENSKSVGRTATGGCRPRNRPERNAILIAACAAIGLLAASAANSGPAESAAESAATDQLVEITVTAQRHVENAQKVPISVVPITPDAIINSGALSTDQLAQLVPGIQLGHDIHPATTFIPGIGPHSNATGDESPGHALS